VLQVWGSYRVISNIFRFLSLALLAYVAAMFFARPSLHAIAAGFFHPGVKFDRNVLAILVAMIGTSLSAYLFTWQSNQEVEEKIAEGKVKLRQRRGTSEQRLQKTLLDVLFGMFFSALVMYAIIIATGATLFQTGQHNIQSATDAAKALTPLAGHAAALLFTAGIVGVGFLAIPVITAGAAYNICQSVDWRDGLHLRLRDGKGFYGSIAIVMAVATAINFVGINPMKALVFAGIVQGFSTPPLLLLILFMTNSPRIMGDKTNTRVMNLFGWATTAVVFAASGALIWSWVAH
jgi:Mn2+/Fe2+ NRAMP family transporter